MTSAVPMLRPARPTSDEGIAFAAYLDTAADGLFRAMLGPQVERIIADAYQETGHDLSYQHVTFAEQRGQIVGMASAYTAEDHRRSSDDVLAQAAGTIRTMRMAIVSILGRPLLRFIDHVPHGDFYLQAVAVDDDQREHGIGSLLIDHVQAEASAHRCRRVVLDVAADNDGAHRLYESRGMTTEAESPHPPFIPSMRVLRMVKPR